jgi:hypothetical protein
MDAFENRINQLPGTSLFTFQPTGCARSNVAIHAANSRMGRVLMSGEFRFHHMTALPAELWRFHVLNRTVCALCANDDVSGGGHSEEDRKLPNVCSTVPGYPQVMFGATDAPPGKEHAKRDQDEAGNEDNRDQNKDNDADVGIAGVPSKLNG